MSITLDRINYLLESHSQAWISKETGIPQSTLSYAVNELREIPSKYNSSIATVYMQDVSYRLNQAGAPANQATRLSINEPGQVRNIQNYIEDTAHKLTEGYIIKQSTAQDIPNSKLQSFIDENYETALSYIRTSLQNSVKPIEEWEDYLGQNEETF